MTLNENPKNYFNEVEQAAFSPSNIVPGISFSPDKMLQARIFSYPDAQRYRIGTHYAQLSVNRPISEINTYVVGGAMNNGMYELDDKAYYEPNSFGSGKEDRSLLEPDINLEGAMQRYDHRAEDQDYYSQPRALFVLMNDSQKSQLFSNIAESMADVSEAIKERAIGHFEQISPEYANGVKAALKAKI